MASPPKDSDGKKRKKLPSIDPFIHFLKHTWRKHKQCKKSVIVIMAAQKWGVMSTEDKQPFYDAAYRALKMLRRAKKCQKTKPSVVKKPKPKPKKKHTKQKVSRCPKVRPKCPRKQSHLKKKNLNKSRCPPCPPCTPPKGGHKK